MKNVYLILLTLCFLFSQCSLKKEGEPTPRVDFDKAGAQLMKELAPQITGNWKLQRLQIKFKNSSYQREIKITKDTTITDLATLTLQPASVQLDPRYGEYKGTIQYGVKRYPVYFKLLANPEWVVLKKAPQAFLLIEYNFPVGSHPTEPEEYYLQQIGFINENFSLEMTSSQRKMIWRGLNRGIEEIEMIKY